MPVEFSDHTTESGFRYTRMCSIGHMTSAHVDQILHELQQPQRTHGRVLAVALSSTQDSETRARYGELDPHYEKMAIVVTRPITRAMINMMLRLNPSSSSRAKIRLFGTEAEGLAWLQGPS